MKKFIRFVLFIIIIIAIYFTTVYLFNQNELYIETEKEQNEIVNKQEIEDFIPEIEEFEENNSGEVTGVDEQSGDMDFFIVSGDIYEIETVSGDLTEEFSDDYNHLLNDIIETPKSGDDFIFNSEV